VANWLMEELREHGYRVSPGTLYPLLSRMVGLGWLRKGVDGRYAATPAGQEVLREVQSRLVELLGEVFPRP
jgi:DNA-binding PadR family transcriptional regulator